MTENYLRAVFLPEEIGDLSRAEFRNDTALSSRTVNGLPYRDPDCCCRELYRDLKRLYFGPWCQIEQDMRHEGQLVLCEGGERYTADYIGPSLTSMCRAGIDDRRAWDLTLACRTVGGHTVFPQNGLINPKKAVSGMKGTGISDRIDVCLYEIKCFLEGSDDPPLNPQLRRVLPWAPNRRMFGEMSFMDYCERYHFLGSFVDGRGGILWLADPERKPLTPELMESYAEKNAAAIQRRTAIIRKKYPDL